MEQNSGLQRRQRVNILHITRPARHLPNDGLNFTLGEGNQRQHSRRDGGAAVRDQVGGHDKRLGVMPDSLRHFSQNRGGKYAANVEPPAPMTQPFDQADNHQRMAAEFKEMVMAADLFQSQQLLPDLCQRDFALTDRRGIVASGNRR
ncbi:hypothetical protein Xkoz_03774 [Xenorhabdus kozodoii]|uniref:Uncharacterized protein n=1 Tax=Xenorhabdus kozodoii TaxID=351676 RepID=A0A2D0KXA7_9GAMM|nr:hypothetical protein Xkoz_03774 [Xenorhabdus kozodoii]